MNPENIITWTPLRPFLEGPIVICTSGGDSIMEIERDGEYPPYSITHHFCIGDDVPAVEVFKNNAGQLRPIRISEGQERVISGPDNHTFTIKHLPATDQNIP
jgi:hypothetical protein